jgi:hypothetical protein
MKQKTRDSALAILSCAGIFWFVERFLLVISLPKTSLMDALLEMGLVWLLAFKLFATALVGLIVWKKVKLSEDYSNYFIVFFLLGLGFQIIEGILII